MTLLHSTLACVPYAKWDAVAVFQWPGEDDVGRLFRAPDGLQSATTRIN